jgi:hypothetical protein
MEKNARAYRKPSPLPSPIGRGPVPAFSLWEKVADATTALASARDSVAEGRMRAKYSFLLALLILTSSGCKKFLAASYPGAKIAEATVAIAKTDYKKTVEARRAGSSLQIMYPYTGSIESETAGLDPKAADALDDLLQAGTRVVLSTDDPPEFLEILLWNPDTGQSFAVWRYVPDIRRFMHTDYPTLESIERMVMIREDPEHEDSFWPRPATEKEFLARQIIQRVKRRNAWLEAREDLTRPGILGIVIENWATAFKDGTKEKLELINWVGSSSREIIGSYPFKGFQGIELLDGSGSALHRWTI